MPSYCSVPMCNGRAGFEFPQKSQSLKAKWVKAMNRINQDGSEWVPTDLSVVCEKHFNPVDFKPLSLREIGAGKPLRKLKDDAVPTIFLRIQGQNSNSGRKRAEMRGDYKQCVAHNCPGIGSTFPFPRPMTDEDMLRLEEWRTNANRPEATYKMRLCEGHFMQDQFKATSKRKLLKADAVPTLFKISIRRIPGATVQSVSDDPTMVPIPRCALPLDLAATALLDDDSLRAIGQVRVKDEPESPEQEMEEPIPEESPFPVSMIRVKRELEDWSYSSAVRTDHNPDEGEESGQRQQPVSVKEEPVDVVGSGDAMFSVKHEIESDDDDDMDLGKIKKQWEDSETEAWNDPPEESSSRT